MKIKLNKDSFEEILLAAIDLFGYNYVLDQVRNANVELNFDDDNNYEDDTDSFWEGDD